MSRTFAPIVRLGSLLLLALAATAVLRPAPARGQSYCRPVTLINFNGTNGSYPIGGVTFDSHGTMYGTTATGGNSSLGTICNYTPSAGLTTLFTFRASCGVVLEEGSKAVGAALIRCAVVVALAVRGHSSVDGFAVGDVEKDGVGKCLA